VATSAIIPAREGDARDRPEMPTGNRRLPVFRAGFCAAKFLDISALLLYSPYLERWGLGRCRQGPESAEAAGRVFILRKARMHRRTQPEGRYDRWNEEGRGRPQNR